MADEKAKTPEAPPAPAAPAPPAKAGEVQFSGNPGTVFGIDGQGFGEVRGIVLLNGASLPITRWKDTSIKGSMPSDAKPGAVEIRTPDNRVFTGYYGSKPK